MSDVAVVLAQFNFLIILANKVYKINLIKLNLASLTKDTNTDLPNN